MYESFKELGKALESDELKKITAELPIPVSVKLMVLLGSTVFNFFVRFSEERRISAERNGEVNSEGASAPETRLEGLSTEADMEALVAAVRDQARQELFTEERLRYEQIGIERIASLLKEQEIFKPEEWAKFSMEQRHNIAGELIQLLAGEMGVRVRSFANAEMESLGVCTSNEHGLKVGISTRLYETDSPRELIETVLHELRHAYQMTYINYARNLATKGIDHFDRNTAEQWSKAYEQYATDVGTYTHNLVELDADRFAKEVVIRWLG